MVVDADVAVVAPAEDDRPVGKRIPPAHVRPAGVDVNEAGVLGAAGPAGGATRGGCPGS